MSPLLTVLYLMCITSLLFPFVSGQSPSTSPPVQQSPIQQDTGEIQTSPVTSPSESSPVQQTSVQQDVGEVQTSPTTSPAVSTNDVALPVTTTEKNDTGAQLSSPSQEIVATSGAGAESNLTEATNPDEEEVAENVGNIDERTDGEASDLAEYIKNTIGELLEGSDTKDNNEDNSESADKQDEENIGEINYTGVNNEVNTEEDTSEDHSISVSIPDLQNCSLPASLDRYYDGEIPNEVLMYFDKGVTVQGLLQKFFNASIIFQLQTTCDQGSWCLSDNYHQYIIDTMTPFYEESYFCSTAMSECLSTMENYRSGCGEQDLSLLISSRSLMCSLAFVDVFNDYVNPECYARSMEALYVTYADFTWSGGSKMTLLSESECSPFKIEMTRCYLCADAVCRQYEQKVLLSEFKPWSDFGMPDNAADIDVACGIGQQCQTDYQDPYTEAYPSPDYSEYDEEEEEFEEIEEELEEALEKAGEEEENEDNSVDNSAANVGNAFEEEDRAMVFGLVTMTTLLLVGAVLLAFIGYRRYRKNRFASYRRGYSQLTEEESKMLRNEYR